jgi:DNA-binding NtrC family response regulator
MPHLNGPETATEMLVRDAGCEKIPVLLLSAKLDLHEVAAAVGTRYFLGKPYSFDALLAMIARALEERSAPLPPASARRPRESRGHETRSLK